MLDCPFCGRPVPYPGLAGDGSETMAECDRCDVYFGFDPEEVYVLESADRAGRARSERATSSDDIDRPAARIIREADRRSID